MDTEIQPDGRMMSRIKFDGWRDLTERIRDEVDAVIQFGIASSRIQEKIELMSLQPEMMSYCFNVHDEYFHSDESHPPVEIYAIHPRDELAEFSKAALEHGVKPEVETFYTGALWNLDFIRKQGLLEDPIWTTLFLGWPGGAWTPADPDSLLHLLRYVPEDVNWNMSILDPVRQWRLVRWRSVSAATFASAGRTIPTCRTGRWPGTSPNWSKSWSRWRS